jgi:hypothetical protein
VGAGCAEVGRGTLVEIEANRVPADRLREIDTLIASFRTNVSIRPCENGSGLHRLRPTDGSRRHRIPKDAGPGIRKPHDQGWLPAVTAACGKLHKTGIAPPQAAGKLTLTIG